MLTHIRQDVVIRALPGWLVLGPFLTLSLALLIGVYGAILHDLLGLLPAALPDNWVLWMPWLPPAIYLAYGRWKRRASDLDLALPLPARRLWLAHGLSLGFGAAAILVLSATLMAFTPGVGLGMVDAALRLLAGLVIAVVVLESRQPAIVRLTPGPVNLLLLAAVLTAVPVLVLRLDVGWVLGLLGLVLALGSWTWHSLPAALALEPAVYPVSVAGDRPRGLGKEPTPPVWSFAPGSGDVFPQIQSANRFHRWLLYLLLYPILFLYGIVSTAALLWGEGEGVMFAASLLAVFLLLLATQVTSSQLAMLDPLPVSRRSLFAAMVMPAFAAWLLGCGIIAVVTAGEPGRPRTADQTPAGVTLAIVIVLTGVLWFCLFALSLRFPSRRATSGMTYFYALVAALVALEVLLGVAVRLGWLAPEAPIGFIRRLAAVLPEGKAALVFFCTLVLGAGYVLAERWFRRLEIAPQRGEPETLGGV